MLIDIWDPRDDRHLCPAVTNFALATKHQAKRYSFSNEVVTEIGGLLRDYPNVLIDHIQFALPPYETTYLEFNTEVLFQAMRVPTSADRIGPDAERDETVGYLLHKGQLA